MQYAAFLGHQPQISIAELSTTLEDFSLGEVIDNRIALFNTSEKIDQSFLDELGGTMLIAQRITEESLTLDDIPQVLLNEIKSKRGKITFSLRTIHIPRSMIGTIYRRCKKRCKDAGRGCRYVGSEKKPAATAVLHEAELIDGKDGCELVLMHVEEEEDRTLWIGKTIAAQDIDWYTTRDMEKPVRDTTVGLLPPKLAQIMINFGDFLVRETNSDKSNDVITILDPFCGTGVIPMEAIIREFPVLASDISMKAVNGCKKNIDWIRKEEEIFKKDVSSEVFKHDALKPFDLKELPDVIVTETTLGPPMSARPSQKETGKLKTQNEKLQCDFLENAASSLPGVPIVCAWPAWKQKGGWVRLEKVWKTIDKLKYRPSLPPEIEPEDPKRFSLFYRRKDQFVGREIVLLMPPKS
ncbi:MAG: RsmD family RNA methyltransferase [Candidatus Peribacteraceae bacterium]|jgi:tRNA G10  N-methylase Trm11|nr:RsmD family RNA methyltransferase [Candidatus Peribacteraceae bacterium]